MEFDNEPLLLGITRYFKHDESVYVYPYLYSSSRERDVIHYHDFYELVIVRSGSGEHITKDGSYAIYPGDAFLIRPGDRHGYCNLRQLELINLLYRPEKLHYLLDEITESYLDFTAHAEDGLFVFDKNGIKGRLEFGYKHVWLVIEESADSRFPVGHQCYDISKTYIE